MFDFGKIVAIDIPTYQPILLQNDLETKFGQLKLNYLGAVASAKVANDDILLKVFN